MHLTTTGYSMVKGTSNAIGHITEAIFDRNISPYRGSPITTDEYLGGYYGTQDGLFGIPK